MLLSDGDVWQVKEHYDAGNGLHQIDMVLLPQPKIPFRIAVQVDGRSHFLYEDYRLQHGPPRTR